MASLNSRNMSASRRITVAFLTAAILTPAAAEASSIVRQSTGETARASLTMVPVKAVPSDAAACAAAFHARFAEIKAGPFAALKLAGSAEAGPADPTLTGQLVFAPSARPREAAANAALRSAVALARRQGRTVQPADANARWIAARIREDLSDFLSQGPSPYLCGGIENYLATMKRYADQIGVSPDRRQQDLEAQRKMAGASLKAAMAALRPVAIPTAAPADRPDPTLMTETLRRSVDMHDRETMGPPMLLADRQSGQTKMSEGSSDPDLPPLSQERAPQLDDEADILNAIDNLLRAAETSGQMTESGRSSDTITTGSIGVALAGRPVLGRLQDLKPRLIGAGSRVRDPQVRMAMVAALSDLEALDYLRLAANEPADPMGAAFSATFDAIAAAHVEACGCRPSE